MVRLFTYGFPLFGLLRLLLVAEPVYAQIQFDRHTISANFGGAYWVFAVDMDGDRDLDLVTASTKDGVAWWRNSSGSFSKNTIGALKGTWHAYAADLDGDGDMDGLGASSSEHQFVWFEQKNGFNKHVLGDGVSAESVHAADLDADGDLDILGAAWGDDKIYWWQNTGNGGFTQKTLDDLRNPHSVYAADIDNDGRTDGIATGIGGTYWYRNEGKGNFTRKVISSKGGWSVFAADMDGDGDQDILRTQRNNGDVVLFKNSGGGFSSSVIEAGYGECWSVAAGDVDGDGNNDIAAAGFDANNVMVWLNNGNGTFGKGLVVDEASEVRSVYIGDLDGDGDGDVAAAIRGDKALMWYEVKGSAAPPKSLTLVAPNGDENLQIGESFRIEWTSTGNIQKVGLEYSRDGGGSWTSIVGATDNDGRYEWTIPDAPTSSGLIRVYDVNGVSEDVSDRTFLISEVQKSITLVAPNGGEILTAGTEFRIEWRSTGNIATVSLEYSVDGGASWISLAQTTDNDGVYDWQVPPESTSRGLVRVASADDAGVSDESDGAFTIDDSKLSFSDITLAAGTGGPEGVGETGGHAALFADVDADGLPDLYITMLFDDPMSDLFFRNTGQGVFVSEASLRGIADLDGGSHGATFADLDNDGDYDLYNGTTYGTTDISSQNNIFLNDGNGFFVDVTSTTGIPERPWPTRAALAFDMDNDGDLDLLAITNYQGSADPPDERNEFYRNEGNLQFTAIDTGAIFTAPAGQGATDTDYDGDGDIDIIAANRTGDVNILNNDGFGNFTLISPDSLGITHQAGDGITAGDIDNDGDLDLLLVPANSGHLYRNNGDGTFTFVQSFLETDGYMGAFGDLDNDGDLDLVFAGDDVSYLNDGLGHFTTGPAIPVAGINDPRAVAFADIDNDGDLDFAFAAKRSRNWLVRNNLNSGNWLKVKLISPQGQAGAFGAKTRIYPAGDAGGQLLGMRESRSNNGYLGQNDPVLHFGLGTHLAVDVVVEFLDGTIEIRENVAANQTLTIDASDGLGSEPKLPEIASFSPVRGPVATEVTILGKHFTGTTEVRFNNLAAPEFTVDSDEQIRARVPDGASSGRIAIINADGMGTSPVDFIVTPAPGRGGTFVFQPTDDAYVRSTRPDEDYGTDIKLKIKSTPSVIRNAYLKFDVSGLTGILESAKIRLYVSEGGVDGGAIYSVSNELKNGDSWSEIGLTWNNAPPITGSPLSALDSVAVDDTVEFDVTEAISGDGTYSFALHTDSDDRIIYSSKEGPVAPELVITTFDEPRFAPTIADFTPRSGPVGTEVTISGRDFQDVTEVLFNEHTAHFSVDSDSVIRAVVPEGATTGPISVVNDIGKTTSTEHFVVIQLPEILGFTPEEGVVGTEVTLTGRHFVGITEVSFGEIPAGFNVDGDSTIRAIVPEEARTAPISVTNIAGTATSAQTFRVWLAPEIVSFSPLRGLVGTEVSILGRHFTGTTDVAFNGTSAEFVVDSDSTIRALVPADASTGPIRLTNPGGSVISVDSFTVELPPPPPPVQHLLPIADAYVRSDQDTTNYGQQADLRIRGGTAEHRAYLKFLVAGLQDRPVTAALNLHVMDAGAKAGSVYLVSNSYADSSIAWTESGLSWRNAPEPSGVPIASFLTNPQGTIVEVDVTAAISGDGEYSFALITDSDDLVKISSKEGPVEPQLIVVPSETSPRVPVVQAFWPQSGGVGTEITVIGTNFLDLEDISFNGVSANERAVDSNSQVRVKVPESASSGKIVLKNKYGTASSMADFHIIKIPEISAITPGQGSVGTVVTIQGYFAEIRNVTFGGKISTNFSILSPQEIRAEVPNGAISGYITVSNYAGTAVSPDSFMVTAAPVLTSFTPLDGIAGTTVTIFGQNLSGARSVVFNTAPSSQYTVVSDSLIYAEVPEEGRTGKITVATAGGAARSDQVFTCIRVPVIASFSPSRGVPGTEVTIIGEHFTGTTAVAFNDVPASTFAVETDTLIRATVPENASSGEISVRNPAGAALSVLNFSVGLPATAMFGESAVPETYGLSQNYPNPFNPDTQIRFQIPEATTVVLKVVDILGREVKTLVNERKDPGFYSITWDGTDRHGVKVSSGVYYYQIVAGDFRAIRKALLMK